MKLFSFGKSTVFLFFAVISLCSATFAFADDANAKPSGGAAIATGADESGIYLAEGNAGLPGAKPVKAPSSIWILLRVVIVLAIVCAAIYGVVWLLKKTTVVNAANDPYLKSVSSITLAPNKTVQVVTIGSKAYLIGVTDQNINLIDEITDTELIDAMNLESDRKASAPPASFASVLSSFLPGSKARAARPERPSAAEANAAGAEDEEPSFSATDVIKRQRERLAGASREGEGGERAGSNPRSGGLE
jgi:flagellar protein FliO/FliZ